MDLCFGFYASVNWYRKKKHGSVENISIPFATDYVYICLHISFFLHLRNSDKILTFFLPHTHSPWWWMRIIAKNGYIQLIGDLFVVSFFFTVPFIPPVCIAASIYSCNFQQLNVNDDELLRIDLTLSLSLSLSLPLSLPPSSSF